MRIDSSKIMVWGAILIAVVMGVAQEATKEWTIKRTDTPDILQFTVRRFKPGSQWSSTNNVPRSRFQGLSIDTLEHGGTAKFAYVQDAGSLVCQGRFSWGGGSGEYTFVPSAEFREELRRLGYIPPDEDQQFSMLILGVSLDFARGVKDAGLRASVEQLIDLRVHGVTLEFIADTRHAGYTSFTAQDFIDLRIHGVRSDYLRDLKSYGYNLDAHDIVDLRIHGVTTEFVRDLKQAGYDLPAQQITDLSIHGVNSEYMRQLKSFGLRPAASELTQLRNQGVTPEYLRGMKEAGYGKLAVEEVVNLRIHGVEPNFVQQAHDLGYNFTSRELVDLRIHGVNGDYLRTLRDAGMKNLSAEQIQKLKMHGID